MALHEQSVGATDEWYTPRYIFTALGCTFDVDVASPGQDVTPWIPAKVFITSNSLQRPWVGFVWMNPPFGPRNGTVPWLEKFFGHGNGIALVPDRTSAPWWQRYAPSADLVLFVSPKIRFIAANGLEGSSPAQGTTLLAAGQQGVAALRRAAANGLGVLMIPTSGAREAWQSLPLFDQSPRVMTRTRPPDRRLAENFELQASGLRYTRTVGRFPDGRLAKIFLTNHKAGSYVDDPEAVRLAPCRDADGTAIGPLGVALDLVFGQK